MGLEPDDKLQMIIDKPYCTAEDHARAYAYLRRRHAEGKLPPVLDGTGNPLKDYVSILGLRT